jgi:hypothetical protein
MNQRIKAGNFYLDVSSYRRTKQRGRRPKKLCPMTSGAREEKLVIT